MCYDLDARPPIAPVAGAAIDAEDLVLTTKDGTKFSAYMANAEKANGAQVLIYPDVRGLHQSYKELAQRFAEIGLSALAIDYFGRTAGTTARDDKFEYMPHVQQMTMPTFLEDVRAALDYLHGKNKAARVFVVGFCRGGTLSLLNATEDLNLAGIVAFYAGVSRLVPGANGATLDEASKVRAPVLGLFGGADQSIPPSDVQKLDEQLDVAGVKHEIITHPGAPHSFFDRSYEEFTKESADAWKRTRDFIAANSRKI